MSKINLTYLLLVACSLQIGGGHSSIIELADQLNQREATSKARAQPTCGYQSCPATDAAKINVHLIAHTHDDVGWLKTVDQYYYGTKKRFSPVGVQHILDSVVAQLVMDKSKRFIYVEMSFFSKWWQEQDDRMRAIVRRLVNEGRLEFINGGWCMNDEATVSYRSTIEQMTLGLKFLNETFGPCAHPKVGWQIDPFGHSSEQASLFAQFGFDGMYFTRIGYADKLRRTLTKSLDLIWHGDRILAGQSGSIFANIFRDGYDAPNGYCFDVICLDDNLVDNQRSYEYNIEQKGKSMVNFIRNYAASKLTNQLLIPFGGDFQFSAAGQNFKNLDKLIKYIRSAAPDLNIFYSTPSCYQYEINKLLAAKSRLINLPEKYDDFMPYDSSPTVWWSGYFSSRPSVKLIERELAKLLQIARTVSLANLIGYQNSKSWTKEVRDHESKCLQLLWEVLGDLQHHDAITGTEKQHVTNDYIRRASDAMHLCAKFMGDLRRSKLNDYVKRSPKYEQLREAGKRFKLDSVYLEDTMFCPLLNISQCDAIESELNHQLFQADNSTRSSNAQAKRERRSTSYRLPGFPPELVTKAVLLNVYNPTARSISQHDIRIPCNSRCDLDKISVIHLSTNETMKLVRLPIPSGVGSLPFRDAITNFEVLFYANVPALGYTSFIIEDLNTDDLVDEESDNPESIVITDFSERSKSTLKSRRVKRDVAQYEYFPLNLGPQLEFGRGKRESSQSQQTAADRVIVKFDLNSGMIVGLRRLSDGSGLNISQKFGYYQPAESGHQPGAYIFRPNSSEPILLDKPIMYKMYKRRNGALIEIHQKWADWLWQTIRVDAKKNYIEFDYVVGPIPARKLVGREVVTRYITNLAHEGVFLTDSNGRQLLARHRSRSRNPAELGGSFYPVVSTIMLKSSSNATKSGKRSAEAVAILVDRAQAGTSLNEGEIELLIHRRLMEDDSFGVGEPLDEPGEDGRGLVVRGQHRLYLKFADHQEAQASGEQTKAITKPQLFQLPETDRANLTYERDYAMWSRNLTTLPPNAPTYILHDQLLNDIRQECIKFESSPILTFDRLRVSASEFMEMINSSGSSKVKTDLSLLNATLPNNIHLLTLQPWNGGPNELLIRLENLDNPLTIHPFPDYQSYLSLLRSSSISSEHHEVNQDGECPDILRPKTEVDIEYLIRRIRIVSLEELNLGANSPLKDDQRLNWTDEREGCESNGGPTLVKLAPRQIRTFLARFEWL